MKRRTLISAVLAILAIGMAIPFGGAASAAHHPSDLATDRSSVVPTVFQQYGGNTPQQAITIGVRPNGTGVVTVQYRLSLNDANETAAFRQLRANITANPSGYRTRFGTRMDRVVKSAQAATGRQMTATKPAINATQQGTTGIVTYSFVWTNLATRSGERLRVGDVLTGFYLDDGQQLTITWPAGYELARVRPSPDSRQATALRWNASTTFGETEPLVELAPTNRSTTNPPSSTEVSSPPSNSSIGTSSVGTNASSGDRTTATRNASGTGDKTNASNGGQTPSTTDQLQTLLIVVGAVVGLVLLAAIRYRRHRTQKPQSPPNEAITNPDSESTSEGDESQGSPTELLSNEERVIQVLECAGGRAKQQHVVEELGWTDAKTSQVVSDLREDGTITGFRLGRENVLELADTETDGDDSPAE